MTFEEELAKKVEIAVRAQTLLAEYLRLQTEDAREKAIKQMESDLQEGEKQGHTGLRLARSGWSAAFGEDEDGMDPTLRELFNIFCNLSSQRATKISIGR